MIVGTAGHIDHGKTSLVRSLTGIDTDRLPEEKARGISIELGFAYVTVEAATIADAAAPATLGFIDVPGHERFVPTMVAGAGGIDFALLVLAADDGPMPQTREHLAILGLLGIDRGAIALTKIDRVDAVRLADVRMQLQALLANTPLSAAPVFEVVATDADDAGVLALRRHLHAAAAALARKRRGDAERDMLRMPIDRILSVPGHGTVVAGMLYSGRIDAGATAMLLPCQRTVRVRGLHVNNRFASRAEAGQRCALNLAGIERDAIGRGDWIADPQALVASTRIDARLYLLPDSGLRLRDWLALHLHWGGGDHLAHMIALEPEADPTKGILVQWVFDSPVCAPGGIRFIARDARAAQTIGGGMLLDPEAPHRRRRSAARLAWLTALQRLHAGEGSAPLLRSAPQGITRAQLARHCGRQPAHLQLPTQAVSVETRAGGWIIHRVHWRRLQARLLRILEDLHRQQPDAPGFDSARLRRIISPMLDPASWQALIRTLLVDGRLQRNGHWLHAPGRQPCLNADERQRLTTLIEYLHAGRFDPPWVRTLATALNRDERDIRAWLRMAAAAGEAFQVVPDLFYSRGRIDELATVIASLAAGDGAVAAADFRDAVGLGRKRSIQILEFFDRVGYTRRIGDRHHLRSDSGWRLAPAPGDGLG